MRVLMTSILCQTGLMTHVRELTWYLRRQGVEVVVAYKKVNYLTPEAEMKIHESMGVPYYVYETPDQLLAFVKERQPDLIHSHSYETFTAATQAAWRLGLPLVITLHSVFPWMSYFPETLQYASRIIAVGPAQGKTVQLFSEKTSIIPNGVDLTRFHPNQEHIEKQHSKINILWYGRVDGLLARGLRVLDRVALKLPSYIQIRALGSVGYRLRNIPHLGWIDNPVPYLQESHITFGHSRSLREAMACGSVGMLLGFNYGGFVTEKRLQEMGLAVDAFPQYRLPAPRSKTILRDILNLVEEQDLTALRWQARDIAERYFDLETMGEATLQIYQEVV